ncbi:MAG: hypothetical protein ABIQ85_04210, partial [Cypionkella sp.]
MSSKGGVVMQNNSRTPKRHAGPQLAPSLLVALSCLAGLPAERALAQEAGGTSLSFGLSQRLEASDNLQLKASNPQSSITSATSLSFNLTKATPISSLALSASALLRLASGDGAAKLQRGLVEPNVKLSYERALATAAFSLTAGLRSTDIAAGSFSIIDPDTGLPVDVVDDSGTGRRQSYDLGTKLDLAQDAPVSYTLSAGVSGVNYINASNPSLFDSQRVRFGAAAHFALSEVTTASLGLSYGRFTTDNPAKEPRVTTGIEASLKILRPNGAFTSSLSTDHTPDGNRTSLSFGRNYDLPNGALSASIGMTRGVTGTNSLNGALTYNRDLANGKLNLALRQSVTSGETTDAERKVAAISLGYQRELSQASSFSF